MVISNRLINHLIVKFRLACETPIAIFPSANDDLFVKLSFAYVNFVVNPCPPCCEFTVILS
mgnify:FL=1